MPVHASPDRSPPPRQERPLVIGILGGIASGKSAAARLLAGPRGWILAADKLAHQVLASRAGVARLRERLGPESIDAAGRPDRAWIANLVFSDPETREWLEGWTHPAVRAKILERLADARSARVPRVVLDVPLLLENDAEHGFVGLCDVLVYVDAPLEQRDRRAVRHRAWAPGEVFRREAIQLPLSEKRARADYVLSNSGSLEELEVATRELLDVLDPD